jgi:hypothetical protein
MKLRLLFFAVFLMLASCSGDDDATTENSTATDLKEIAYYDATENLLFGLSNFQDNKVTEKYGYFNQEISYIDHYIYDNNGRLTSRYFTEYDIPVTQDIEYDDSGRIVLIKDDYDSFVLNKVFDYTSSNKIVMTETATGSMSYTRQCVYDLLPDGRIYKITSDYKVDEVQYTGNNITSRTLIDTQNEEPYTIVYNYTYDNQNPVKGEYLSRGYNQFGTNKANEVIFLEDFIIAKDNYILSDGTGNTKVYEFNSDGYPVKELNYTNAVLKYWFEISYQ